jgi:uncharacterized protein (UPF0264 family)
VTQQPATKLLVSVRDVEEAKIAIEAGVDLIDLKEPNHGALGAVDLQTARDVVAMRDAAGDLRNAVPLSMALGELVDYFPHDVSPGDSDIAAPHETIELPVGIHYYKIGLAGCAHRKHWHEQLQHFVRRTIRRHAFVAVAYADHQAVDAPPFDEVLVEAIRLNARAVLVDTAVKDGRTLLDHWSRNTLRDAIRAIGGSHMLSVVGGGLQAGLISDVARCHPDYVAVRGAVCLGGRDRKIDAERIAMLRAILPHGIV